jgi:predicted lipoprotein with Yx(FWY)xxD motif
MKRRNALLLAAILPLAVLAQQPQTRITDGVLTDGTGMTLYTSDLDGPTKSNCNGACAVAWPPLAAPSNAKPWAEYMPFARADGSQQWAYKGKPLYRFSRDQAPGDKGGDGSDNVWRVARP